MFRFRWPVFLVVLAICLPVAVLASGVPIPFFDRPAVLPRPVQVPGRDQEMAWLHTSTNGQTWERFVAGVARAQALVPGLVVDDSAAFIDQTTAVPEVVLSLPGKEGRLRIRWYKLTNEATTADWVAALSRRSPAPLAVIGGGSSDRAVDLARALAAQEEWRGDRPLMLITTATADEIDSDAADPTSAPPTRSLMDVYPRRSFRFCFTNKQMAEAVLDFVWATPGLRPETFARVAPQAACSGLVACPGGKWVQAEKPHVFSVNWRDDPYSTDLSWQFKRTLDERLLRGEGNRPDDGWANSWGVPFSVGGFLRANPHELNVAGSILSVYQQLPPQRSLLILPTVTQPARRLLKTLCDSAPRIGSRVVAVTGDGISVNAVYRDGEFQWPIQAVPVPLVLFTHADPVGWDDAVPVARPPAGYELVPPTATDDVLHFAELTRVVAESCFGVGDCPGPGAGNAVVARADDLAAGLRGRCPTMFDDHGDRLGGSGEYVVVLWPHRLRETAGTHVLPEGTLEVWRQADNRRWALVRSVFVDQRRTSSAPTTAGGRPAE